MKQLFSGRAVFVTLVFLFLSKTSPLALAQTPDPSTVENSVEPYSFIDDVSNDSFTKISLRLCGSIHPWMAIAKASGVTAEPYWVLLHQKVVVPCMKSAPVPAPAPVAKQKQPLARTPVAHISTTTQPDTREHFRKVFFGAFHSWGMRVIRIAGISLLGVLILGFVVVLFLRWFYDLQSRKPVTLQLQTPDIQNVEPLVSYEEAAASLERAIAVTESEHNGPIPAMERWEVQSSTPYVSTFGAVQISEPNPTKMTPTVVNPTLADLQSLAVPACPAVAFVTNGIVAYARFDRRFEINRQKPTIFIEGYGTADFLFPCEYDEFETHVEEILKKQKQSDEKPVGLLTQSLLSA